MLIPLLKNYIQKKLLEASDCKIYLVFKGTALKIKENLKKKYYKQQKEL